MGPAPWGGQDLLQEVRSHVVPREAGLQASGLQKWPRPSAQSRKGDSRAPALRGAHGKGRCRRPQGRPLGEVSGHH